MTNEDGLLELRNKLDNVDNTLLDLINQRMKIVHEVGALKKKVEGQFIDQKGKNQLLIDLKKSIMKMLVF